MKLSYHGPISDTSVIRKSTANVFDIKAGLNDSDLQLETIAVTPNPTTVFGLEDSDFGFSTAITGILGEPNTSFTFSGYVDSDYVSN